MAKFTYLSDEVLNGFDNYKYSSIDTSPISKYVTHPFWNWVVEFYPRWIAPNLLTLTGFLQLVANFFLLTYYDCNFYAASRDHPESPPVPNWVWLVCGLNMFISHTLDGTDGKQARRTKTSSPLGELFDHGLDSWVTLFMPVAMYSVYGRGEGGVDVFRVFLITIGVQFCFMISHWEKYITGVLFLPWGYDLSQLGLTFIYLLTFLGGHDMWKFKVPIVDMQMSNVFEIVCYVGFLGLTMPFTFWNIYESYKNKTGKMLGLWEAMRPVIATISLFSLMIVWAKFSSCDIIELYPRLFYLTTGTVFSNITCRLIIAQMSNTRCEVFHWMLVPLCCIVALVILIAPGNIEIYILWCYALIVISAHVHFGFGVVREMCDHFKINALTIKHAD
ncbi:ethanolaminephosphotransferase 1-like [Mytilus edulis]